MNNGFTNIREWWFKCETCGEEVSSGIVSLSSHWAECTGKSLMESVRAIDRMPLEVKDKMDLLKKEFGLDN